MDDKRYYLEQLGINLYTNSKNWIKDFYNFYIKKNKRSTTMKEMVTSTYDPVKNLDDFTDLKQAGKYIAECIKNNKRIAIASDYDCDGLTSAVVLTKMFQNVVKYDNVITLVNRRVNGNGFNQVLIDRILQEDKKQKIDVIITSDHGSTDNQAYIKFKEHGIETVMTDHHTIDPNNYPKDARYVINPMREDSYYDSTISGCHVAYLLCLSTYIALTDKTRSYAPMYNLLSYVGISTVVDQMPMDNILNRDIVITGNRIINKRKDQHIRSMLDKLRIGPLVKYKNIGWHIGPYLNSGNRCGTEQAVFDGLTKEDGDRHILYALNINNKRKREQKSVMVTSVDEVYKEYKDLKNTFAIAMKIDTEFGIAGPVASKIGEVFNKPTIVFKANVDNTKLLGSGRAILNINILEVLKEIKSQHPEVVTLAAGHAGACGVEIPIDKLEEFRTLFNDTVKDRLKGKLPIKYLDVAAYIQPEDINLSLALRSESVGPFGRNWDEPVFMSVLPFKQSVDIGDNKLVFFYRYKNTTIKGFYNFSRDNGITHANWNEKMNKKEKYLITYNFNLNYYNGRYGYDVNIIDIIPLSKFKELIDGDNER